MAAEGIALPERFERPGFARLSAADRPGVAQPVPERDIPPRPWSGILLAALCVFVLLMLAWEANWRAYGATPGYRNSDGSWAVQRRRIDEGEGGKTVLIGSSRVLSDVNLDEWQAITGERPIQLALEGTSPMPMLEDLADDPNFTGRLLIGVTPNLFFSGQGSRSELPEYYHHQGPSQRSGHWLSKRFIEPYFAFYDPDFSLVNVVKRLDWPKRPGLRENASMPKLFVQDEDRNTSLWSKIDTDLAYRQGILRRRHQRFVAPPPPKMDTAEKKRHVIDEQIGRAVRAVASLRQRGVRVVFLRPPSSGEFLVYERAWMPREETWDRLLARTGAEGIHFEDHSELQGYAIPDWSHLSASETRRFTAALAPLAKRRFEQEHGGTTNPVAAGR
ncbi:hypothetical protein [Lysobacter fragariae]